MAGEEYKHIRSQFLPLNAVTAGFYKSRIGAVQPDGVPKWGRMTPPELFQHLQKYVRAALEPVQDTGRPPLPWPLRKIALAMLLSPIPMPRNIFTFEWLKPNDLGSVEVEREALVSSIDAFVERVSADPDMAPEHPLFGPLTMNQWAKLNGKHLQHHLVQFGV
jgi:hypothetical protein